MESEFCSPPACNEYNNPKKSDTSLCPSGIEADASTSWGMNNAFSRAVSPNKVKREHEGRNESTSSASTNLSCEEEDKVFDRPSDYEEKERKQLLEIFEKRDFSNVMSDSDTGSDPCDCSE